MTVLTVEEENGAFVVLQECYETGEMRVLFKTALQSNVNAAEQLFPVESGNSIYFELNGHEYAFTRSIGGGLFEVTSPITFHSLNFHEACCFLGSLLSEGYQKTAY